MIQTPYKETLEGIEAIAILGRWRGIYKNFMLSILILMSNWTLLNLPESVKTMDILCPGCPFLVLFKKEKLQCDNIYTNIKCNTIKRIFQVKEGNLTDFIGLTLGQKYIKNYYVG